MQDLTIETDAIETAASDDAIGFEELVGSARPALLRAAHSVTGRHEDAEDAVQSSLLKAMRAWQRVANQERWRQQAYVRQIVVNTCRSGWRKWGSRVAIGDVPEIVDAPETDTIDDRELLRQALARLPARRARGAHAPVLRRPDRSRDSEEARLRPRNSKEFGSTRPESAPGHAARVRRPSSADDGRRRYHRRERCGPGQPAAGWTGSAEVGVGAGVDR